jgi:hypothetical protein
MDPKLHDSIVNQIYRRFPEFRGVQPKVRIQSPAETKPVNAGTTYLYTFQKNVTTEGNKTLNRWVRVVVNQNGKILKVSTSR